MISSMTGYGMATATIGQHQVTTQIKSVNTRHLDIFIRFPGVPVDFEQQMRSIIQKNLHRGRVDAFVEIRTPNGDIRGINFDTARGYHVQIKQLVRQLDISEPVTVRDLLTLPGTLESADQNPLSDKEFQKQFMDLFLLAIDQLKTMRKQEGENLAAVIEERLAAMGVEIEAIADSQQDHKQYYRERLERRLKELLDKKEQIDPDRLHQEVAYLADRSDISEEVDRFRSHLDQFSNTLSTKGPVGKKMDFILQEMHREVNTVLSKTDLMSIKERGIEIKSELEKVREQIQNIE